MIHIKTNSLKIYKQEVSREKFFNNGLERIFSEFILISKIIFEIIYKFYDYIMMN